MSENKATVLAVISDFSPVVLNKAVIMEELEGLELTFDRVKIPSGGGLAFEIPVDDDEVDTVKEIVGVVLDHHRVNAFWPASFSGQGQAPACASMDGKTGVATPGAPVAWAGRAQSCAECPLNQWGSDEAGSGGKACKNMHRIYIVRQGDVFPLLLTLPPTSIRNWANYLAKRVLARGLRPYQVVTKITLKKEQNRSGITYSQAVFKLVGVLNEQLQEQMARLSQDIKRVTRGVSITSEDYQVNTDAAAGHYEDDGAPF